VVRTIGRDTAEHVDRLSRETEKALQKPKVRDKLTALGVAPMAMTPRFPAPPPLKTARADAFMGGFTGGTRCNLRDVHRGGHCAAVNLLLENAMGALDLAVDMRAPPRALERPRGTTYISGSLVAYTNARRYFPNPSRDLPMANL
jgi:hypothetical protein